MNNPLKLANSSSPSGRRFATHITAFKSGQLDLKHGLFDTGGYCGSCGITCPHHLDKVTCSMCGRVYHSTCLQDAVGRSTVAAVVRNPSLWWFCLECLHVSNSLDLLVSSDRSDGNAEDGSSRTLNTSEVSLDGSGSVLDEEIQEHLSQMECKIYTRLKLDLDQTLSQLSLDSNSASNVMYPNFSAKREFQKNLENLSKTADNLSDDLSILGPGRKFSSSSGFSESQESFLSEQIGQQSKAKTLDNSAPTKGSGVKSSSRVNIPEIPRVLSPKISQIPRVLTPRNVERRKRNNADLNEIKNLVNKGRSLNYNNSGKRRL